MRKCNAQSQKLVNKKFAKRQGPSNFAKFTVQYLKKALFPMKFATSNIFNKNIKNIS